MWLYLFQLPMFQQQQNRGEVLQNTYLKGKSTWDMIMQSVFSYMFFIEEYILFLFLFVLLLQGMAVGTQWCIKTVGRWHPRTILGHTQTTLFVKRKSKCLQENAWSWKLETWTLNHRNASPATLPSRALQHCMVCKRQGHGQCMKW